MIPAWKRYLLFTETQRDGVNGPGWRFLLHAVDADETINAADCEPGLRGDRLALMAVVRGLEALEQPSLVKLVTGSRYVRRGIAAGIENWRANDWKWERFGKLVPVRDNDLWRRVDSALRFHRLSCRGWHETTSEHVAKRPATKLKSCLRPMASAVEQVVEGVINEPALLVVRGRRRHVMPLREGEPCMPGLAAAG